MSSPSPFRQPPRNERGIVLAAALLFVLLSSVLVMTLMLSAVGERSQSSNAHTARLALYAADAGVRTQQQVLANLAKAKIDSCLTAWVAAGSNPSQPIVSNPQSLFPTGALGGTNAASSTNPSFSASASVAFADSGTTAQSQAYDYMFTITSAGGVSTTGKRTVQSIGSLRVSATRGSFADYLLFTDQFQMASGGTVWFTSSCDFDGRVHTNTGFKFAYNPIFRDEVTQHDVNATFYNDGNAPVVANADNNGTVDVPQFFGGFQRNQPAIALPANGYTQQNAALGISGSAAPTNAQIDAAIGVGGTGTPPNGIYVPNNGLGVTGGLYVQGSADQVKMWADTLTNKQYYQITQGGTQRTIQIDRSGLGSTQVWNNLTMTGIPTTYLGVPPNGVLFSTGGIADLRGPGRNATTGTVDAALAEFQKMLVAANQDIVIQGDLACDNFNNRNNVLGIFSATGAVRIGTAAPNDLSVDAFVMACGSTNGEFRVDNYDTGSPRGVMTLQGGCVSRFYGAFYTFGAGGLLQTGYARNFHYDRRGLIPPFYPTNTNFEANTPTARTIAWKEI